MKKVRLTAALFSFAGVPASLVLVHVNLISIGAEPILTPLPGVACFRRPPCVSKALYLSKFKPITFIEPPKILCEIGRAHV